MTRPRLSYVQSVPVAKNRAAVAGEPAGVVVGIGNLGLIANSAAFPRSLGPARCIPRGRRPAEGARSVGIWPLDLGDEVAVVVGVVGVVVEGVGDFSQPAADVPGVGGDSGGEAPPASGSGWFRWSGGSACRNPSSRCDRAHRSS